MWRHQKYDVRMVNVRNEKKNRIWAWFRSEYSLKETFQMKLMLRFVNIRVNLTNGALYWGSILHSLDMTVSPLHKSPFMFK